MNVSRTREKRMADEDNGNASPNGMTEQQPKQICQRMSKTIIFKLVTCSIMSSTLVDCAIHKCKLISSVP